MDRIYLDNAATSWPKPDSVYAAVDHAQRILGAPAGRGGYAQVMETRRLVEQTRGLVASYIHAKEARNIAFTFNGTDSLSTAIFGLLKPSDHVVTSVVEHNSVLRPLNHLATTIGIDVTYVGCDETGRIDENQVISAIRPETRLVALIHVSNVTGTIQPIENIKSGIRQRGGTDTVFLVDAAQSLGHVPIDVQAVGCDVLVAPGHKGLLGPLGTGILFVDDAIVDAIQPLRYGGTGTDGSIEIQPTKAPDKFESGNLNVPGIAGLNAGLKFLQSEEGRDLQQCWGDNSRLLLEGIQSIDGVKIQGMTSMQNRIGVISFCLTGWDCHDAAHILDAKWSVQTRAGLHCAPLIHRNLGTEQCGTVRMSVGLFNTRSQIETAVDAVSQLAAEMSQTT